MQKILLADDERDVRSLLQAELEGAGYRVTAVATGAEAVIAAADGGFDLYLLDMMMLGRNGVQSTQFLRKMLFQAPILGLTGYTGQGYMAQASAYNVTCLAKPIDVNDLLGEIKLKLANAARVATSTTGSTPAATRFGRAG